MGLQGGALFLLIHFRDCKGSIEAPDIKLNLYSMLLSTCAMSLTSEEEMATDHCLTLLPSSSLPGTVIQFLSTHSQLNTLRSTGMLGISFWKLISDVVGEQDTEKKNQGKVTLQSANFSSLLNLVLGGLLWSAARTSTKLLVTRKHDS